MTLRHGVAILRLATIGLGSINLSHGHVADIEVACLELLVSGLDVLLNGEVNAIDLGLVVAIVVVVLNQVDLLAVLPLAVHLERAVTNGCQVVVRGIVLSSSRHRGQSGVRGHIGEVCISGAQLNHEGVVVGAGNTSELVGFASGKLVITFNKGQVVRNLRGAINIGDLALGVYDTSPSTLEALGVNSVAVVEGSALAQLEGELSGLVVGLEALASQRNNLFLVVVIAGQRIEQLEADLRALVLLDVIGVDAGGVVNVVAQRATGSSGGIGARASARRAVLLAASSEKRERARSEGAAHEGATTHNGLVELKVSHAILLCAKHLRARRLQPWL